MGHTTVGADVAAAYWSATLIKDEQSAAKPGIRAWAKWNAGTASSLSDSARV